MIALKRFGEYEGRGLSFLKLASHPEERSDEGSLGSFLALLVRMNPSINKATKGSI